MSNTARSTWSAPRPGAQALQQVVQAVTNAHVVGQQTALLPRSAAVSSERRCWAGRGQRGEWQAVGQAFRQMVMQAPSRRFVGLRRAEAFAERRDDEEADGDEGSVCNLAIAIK